VLARGICHDEKVYPDPETFNPDRFLDKDGNIDPSVEDPEVRIFGSGRRSGIRYDLPLHYVECHDLGFVPGDTSAFEICTLQLPACSLHLTFSPLSMRMGVHNHLRQHSNTH